MNPMNAMQNLGWGLPSMPGWAFLLLKITLLLAAAWALHAALGRANPRWRVLLWRIVGVGVALLPLLIWVGPGLEFELDRPAATAVTPEAGRVDTGERSRATDVLEKVAPQTFRNDEQLFEIPRMAGTSDQVQSGSELNGSTAGTGESGHPMGMTLWLLWLLGAGLLVLRGLVGWLELKRVVHKAQAAPAPVIELARRVAADLGCREAELRLTGRISTPFLTGWRQPVVLLPERMAKENYHGRLPAILAHELSHVRAGDVFWTHVIGLVRAVLWFHPLAWGMRRAHAVACEEVSDAVSAAYIGDAGAYSRTLARVAVELAELPPPAAGGIAMARVPEVMRRLERLRRRVFADPLSRRRAAVFVLCAVASFATVGGMRFAYAQEESGDNNFTMIVVDESRLPTEDAIVKMSWPLSTEEVEFTSQELVTAENGEALFLLPKDRLQHLEIMVSKEGFVPMTVTWRDKGGEGLNADRYKLVMEKGTTIGGIVRDEAGHSIPGATVYLLVPNDKAPLNGWREIPAIWDFPVWTDANGRWQADNMPARLDDIMIRLEHPDYISDKFYGATPRPPIAALRAGTGVMVMTQGIRLTGRVLNAQGEPMFDARVNMGASGHGHGVPGTMTDTNGEFVFENCDPGQTVLSIQAGGGWAPELREIEVRPGMRPVEFKLQKAGTVRIRLEDIAGNPIQGARINAEIWRGYETLNKYGSTNEEGRWIWTNAPQDEVGYAISSGGQQRIETLIARDEEYVITVGGILSVSGTVADMETGEPVEGLRVVPGYGDGGPQGTITWDLGSARDGAEGLYGLTFNQLRGQNYVRAEAPGYTPAVSREILWREGQVTLDFILERSKPIEGLALGVDNQPLADAGIMLIGKSSRVVIEGGAVLMQDGATLLKTNSGGGFSVPPQDQAYALLMVHDDGYALIDSGSFETARMLQVKPWNQVEGRLLLGNQPGAQQMVGYVHRGGGLGNGLGIEIRQVVRTDSRGHFVFERMFEGEYDLQQFVSAGGGQSLTALTQRIRIEPGQLRQVVILGGPGVTVTGRLVGSRNAAVNLSNLASLGVLQTRQPGRVITREIQTVDGEGRIVRLLRTLAGQTAQPAPARAEQMQDFRKYMFVVEPDGRFRIENVAPGAYELQISLGDGRIEGGSEIARPVAVIRSNVQVPDAAGQGNDPTLDLGNFTISWGGVDNQSDGYIPEIRIRKLGSDETHPLSDYRGKYVLMHIWAATAPNNLEDLIRLNDVYERYKEYENFTILNLSVDVDDETPLSIARELGLEWFQGHLGRVGETSAATGLNLQQIPALYMIGPDGQILERNFTADTASWQVRRRLEQ